MPAVRRDDDVVTDIFGVLARFLSFFADADTGKVSCSNEGESRSERARHMRLDRGSWLEAAGPSRSTLCDSLCG